MKSLHFTLLLTLALSGVTYAQPNITQIVDPYTGGTKLAPGGQAVITGTNLGLNPLVTVGGVNAFNLVPPQFGPTITIQIPWTAALGSTVPVVVTTGAGPSAAFNVALVQYAPVLISATSGALTSPRHNNGVGVSSTTPAAPGEQITFYAIGLGPTNTAVNTGALAPNNSDSTTTTATVTLGANAAVNASVSRLANSQGFYGASTPGGLIGSAQALIGIYLVTTTVPAGTAAGSYPVTISIGGAVSNSVNVAVGPAPTGPVISAIVGETGKTLLCPGDVAILSGLNLGANPMVTVAGKTAFNVFANNGNQITVQIPVDAPLGPANATLAAGGQTSAPFQITLTQFAPALLSGGNGFPQGASHQSNTPVTSANPAYPGEQLYLLAFGLGPTNPVVPTGTLPASNIQALTTTVPTVNIAGASATGVNASLASCCGSNSTGVYVIQFTVPASVTTGNYPSSISIGGLTTGLTTIQVFSGPTITNVTNAASSISAGLPNAGIAQGAIFTLLGINLGPGTLSIASNPFQSSGLNGTSISVTVAGTTVAPLMYYTSATQVAALLPSNTPVGTGTVTVTYNGSVGLAAPITVVQNNLGIFTVTSDGQGVGIVTYSDYSLVSATSAANCGGPYTTCGSANPGDVLTVWATGLGPVNGSDAAGAGLGVDMPNIPVQLWLGGLSAQVVFRGRGCCIGEDQIAFVVPDNVPTGCAVPLAVQINNQISNYVVIAIAPKGSRTCTASNPTFTSNLVQLLTSSGTITHGEVDLSRQPNSDNQVGAAGNTDYGKAVFVSFTVPAILQPFIVSYLDDLPLGTCAVSNLANGSNNSNYLTNLSPLDAGPGIKVTGPNGSQTIAANGHGQVTLAPGTFLSPGAYTAAGTGGANANSFSQQYMIPTPPILTSPTTGPGGPPVPVTRANGITFNWTGGAPNSVIQIQGGNSTDNSGSVGANFTCFVGASAGTFTVPPAVLLTLPPGAFNNSEWNFVAFSPPGTFPASGLNHTAIQATYSTAVFTLMQ